MIVELFQPGTLIMFKHMNKAIVNRYQRQGVIPDLHEHKVTFEKTHSVRVIVKNSCWQALEFPSEQDYLMAMLKWL
jgi:hypothetical protein